MDFVNRTPFPSIQFESMSAEGKLLQSVLLKISMRMHPAGPDASAMGDTHVLRVEKEPAPLFFQDEFWGQPLASSVKQESDLVPFKPRCDVIVLADAHAPGSREARYFRVGLQVLGSEHGAPPPGRPGSQNADMPIPAPGAWKGQKNRVKSQRRDSSGGVLLERELQVLGERFFRKKRWPVRLFWILVRIATLDIIRRNPWKLTRSRRMLSLPLRYEYAFGGACLARENERRTLRRAPAEKILPPPGQRPGGMPDPPVQAWSPCPWNPLGMGYAEAWELKASRRKRVPAPRIEDPRHPWTARRWWRLVRGKLPPGAPALIPQGFGVYGRAWRLRAGFEGALDGSRGREDLPQTPQDPGLSAWNGAHPSLRMAHPRGNERIELRNLGNAHGPMGFLDSRGESRLSFHLPGHRIFVLDVPLADTPSIVDAQLDTILIDLYEERVSLVWRVQLPARPQRQRLEAWMHPFLNLPSGLSAEVGLP